MGNSQQYHKPRQSNFELLRIVAMFLVLVVHADFWANGVPSQYECINNMVPSITRFGIEAISIVCVNVFVLISGWFGIKPNVKRMSSFIFQCLFFLGGLYVATIILGFGQLNSKGLRGCFCLLEQNWFIKSYVGLCILAPCLNKFIEYSSERQLRGIIIYFYTFQTIYGWLFPAARFIENGYSVFSFIGLYILSQYIRKFCSDIVDKTSGWRFISLYFIIVIANCLLGYFTTLYSLPFCQRIYSYISPLVVAASVCLTLAFKKINVNSTLINWVAASSFAVFLFHTSPALNNVFFKAWCVALYNNYNGIECLIYIFQFLVLIFIISILLDQIRKYLWKFLSSYIFSSSPLNQVNWCQNKIKTLFSYSKNSKNPDSK